MKTTKYSTKENKKIENENKIVIPAFDFDFREPVDPNKALTNVMNIFINQLEEISKKIDDHINRITVLEDISKCDLCKKIAERINCKNCYKLVCFECCNTIYNTDGDSIYYCKKCK
jgi:hypothetical protein